MTLGVSLKELLKNNHDFKTLNPSLENIRRALEIFDNPQNDYESIIVAGTNGKGSVCTFIEQLYLKYSNLKIAKFTSPHLLSVRERISTQGLKISEEVLVGILLEIREKIDFHLSYFEKLSLASFIYFSREKTDLAIIEVGLGGRWDCANIIAGDKRKATVITSIGLDHMEYLGDTVEKIRLEKEAIKREATPHFDYKDYTFNGSTESKNYQLAKMVFLNFNSMKTDIEGKIIFKAYRESYRARFEYLEEYDSLIDSAHNPDAAKALNEYICDNFFNKKVELHLAFLDKDYLDFCLSLSSKLKISEINIYQLENERAALASELVVKLQNKFPEFKIQEAKLSSIEKNENLKVFTGSIYFCAEVLKLISN